GNGKKDLVIANGGDQRSFPEFNGDSVAVLLNTSPSGGISFGAANSLTNNTYGAFAIAVSDFNLDGNPDIAAVNYGPRPFATPQTLVSIDQGNGAGAFTDGSPGTYDTQSGGAGGQFLAVGDFDGNGTPDLIVAHETQNIGLLLNTSPPPVATTTALASSVN